MNRNRIPRALLVALLGAVALAGCKKKEEPAPAATTPPPVEAPAPAPAPMPATASVVAVDLGNTIGADMKIGTPSSTFKPKDTIYVSIGTTTSDPAASVPGKLGVKWSHLDSNQVVKEDARDITFAGNNTTEFHIAKPDGWPTGKYRVEVVLNGAPVQSRDFEVK